MAFSDESIKSYMRTITKVPLLTIKEECELAKLIEQGSNEAREKLTVANLRLVVKIAHDFKSLGIPLSDLICEGNIGLMKAVEKFDPTKGAKFSSYGAWWIKQSMRRAIANQSRIIRIPIQSATKVNRIQKVSLDLAARLGRIPNEEEISEAAEIPVRTIEKLRSSATSGVVSLNSLLQEGEEGSLEDLVPDLAFKTPDDNLNEEDIRSYLHMIVNEKLKERERMIITLRYGLDDGEPKTLEEVSAIIGRTRERVRQIQHLALRKIAAYMDEVQSMPI